MTLFLFIHKHKSGQGSIKYCPNIGTGHILNIKFQLKHNRKDGHDENVFLTLYWNKDPRQMDVPLRVLKPH